MSDDMREPRDRVRWWLGGFSVLVGAALIAVAALIAYEGTSLRGTQASFWSGVLVNMGTTIFLAVVLIWLERSIVTRVRAQSRDDAARAATQAAHEAVQRTIDALTPKLDDLERRVREKSSGYADDEVASAFEAAREAVHAAGVPESEVDTNARVTGHADGRDQEDD